MNALRIRGRLPYAAVVAVVVLAACSSDSPTDADNTPVADALTVTVVVCSYAEPAPGQLQITLPARQICDSAGLVTVPETTTVAPTILEGSELSISLKEMAPLVRLMTSGPSFSSDIGDFLDMLDTMDLGGFVVTADFARLEGGPGLAGRWAFAGVGPPIVAAFLNPDQIQALLSMQEDDQGRTVFMLAFDGVLGEMTGLLGRRIYGDAALNTMIDTVVTDISWEVVGDSTWVCAGGQTEDTVDMHIDEWGSFTYAMRDTTLKTYTYDLEPDSCPNDVAPVWFWEFVAANPQP